VKLEEKEIEFRYISLNNNTQERAGGGKEEEGRRRRGGREDGRRRGGGGGGRRRSRRRRRRRRRRRDGQDSDALLKKAKIPKVKEKVNRRPFAGYGNNNKKDNARIK